MKKRIVCALLAALLLISLAGCRQLTPAEQVMESMQFLRDAKSYASTSETTFSVSVSGITVDVVMKSEIEFIAGPQKVHRLQTAEMLGQTMTDELYAYEENGETRVYVRSDSEAYTGWRLGDESDMLNAGIMLTDAEEMKQLYQENSDDFELLGEVEIGGVMANKIAYSQNSDTIGAALSSSMGALGLNPDTTDDESAKIMAEVLADKSIKIPCVLWANQKTLIPLRESVDYTPLMRAMVNRMMEIYGGGITMSLDSCVTITDYKDIDAVEDFTIPDEVIRSVI